MIERRRLEAALRELSLSAYGGVDGKDLKKIFSVFSPKAGLAGSQRLVLGGRAFGDPRSCAVYRSITLNGKPLF